MNWVNIKSKIFDELLFARDWLETEADLKRFNKLKRVLKKVDDHINKLLKKTEEKENKLKQKINYRAAACCNNCKHYNWLFSCEKHKFVTNDNYVCDDYEEPLRCKLIKKNCMTH